MCGGREALPTSGSRLNCNLTSSTNTRIQLSGKSMFRQTVTQTSDVPSASRVRCRVLMGGRVKSTLGKSLAYSLRFLGLELK